MGAGGGGDSIFPGEKPEDLFPLPPGIAGSGQPFRLEVEVGEEVGVELLYREAVGRRIGGAGPEKEDAQELSSGLQRPVGGTHIIMTSFRRDRTEAGMFPYQVKGSGVSLRKSEEIGFLVFQSFDHPAASRFLEGAWREIDPYGFPAPLGQESGVVTMSAAGDEGSARAREAWNRFFQGR